VEGAADDGALPRTICAEAEAACGEDFLHADSHGAAGDNSDVTADGDGIDRARFASQVEDTRRQGGELLDGLCFAGLRGLVEGEVAIDADTAEACIDAAAGRDEAGDGGEVARIGEDAVVWVRGKRRVEQVVELAIHEAAKTERVVERDPLIAVIEVFVHIDEDEIAAVEALVVDQAREDGELIDGADGDDQRGSTAGATGGSDLVQDDAGEPFGDVWLVAADMDLDGAAVAEFLGRDLEVVGEAHSVVEYMLIGQRSRILQAGGIMKLFLDSAKTDEIRLALEMWDLDGVTTNPRHVRDSGKPFRRVIAEIADLVGGTEKPVSVEVNPHLTAWREIVAEGRELAKLSPNFVVKVGASEGGFKAMRELAREGVRINATLIFSVAQAWHAARAGAAYISPFLGWKEQYGDDACGLVGDVRKMLDNFGYKAEIIAAAIRNSRQISDAAVAGAHCVTAALSVYQDSFRNPYTNMGEGIFQEAWDSTKG
jgi:transaldolase